MSQTSDLDRAVHTHWLRLIGALLLLCAACSPRARHAGAAAASPQAALERQLDDRKHGLNERTSDGGLLYRGDFTVASTEALRVPYDLLQLECENHGGRFERSAPSNKTAASLAEGAPVPSEIYTILRDADARGLFGQHRCDAGGELWSAVFEPVALDPGANPSTFRLTEYVKAATAEGYSPDAPLGPGLPAIGARVPPSAAAPSLPPPAALDEPPAPPSAPPTALPRRAVSPLDPRPPGTPASGDRLLAEPQLFGLRLGEDDEARVAQKLGLDPAAATRCGSPPVTALCWDHPGSEALSVRAGFVALGAAGSRLAELELSYPATSYRWLARALGEQLGPSDTQSAADARSWSWLFASVELSRTGQTTRLHAVHKASLDRAQLPEALRPPPSAATALPWQLQLGYESAQAAQTKLKAAGFEVPGTGCSDGSPAARPVFTRTCPLLAGSMPHVRSAWVRSVDIGDGRARLAELGYQLDKAGWDDTLRDLQQRYGEPIPSGNGVLQWWVGPVGITLSRTPGESTLRYYHGRLLQYFIVAEAKRPATPPAAPASRGL